MYKQSTTGSIVLSPEHFSLGAGEFLGVTSNTNLALSAPALLEALEGIFDEHLFLLNSIGRDYMENEKIIKAKAAIAAARGEV